MGLRARSVADTGSRIPGFGGAGVGRSSPHTTIWCQQSSWLPDERLKLPAFALQVVFFAWDDPEKVEPVGAGGDHDRRMVHAARPEGSRRFPAIAGLAPVRDASARVCASCGGLGKLASVAENIVCECGGLGWVPW